MKARTLLALLVVGAGAYAADPATVERSATLGELFPPEQTESLGKILPLDRAVHFRLRLPAHAGASGVLVFIEPRASGEPPPSWLAVLDQRNLAWIAADDFGNDRPTAQRVLAALMALEVAERATRIDPTRRYVAGMSGGGRAASMAATHFPRAFSGALYIVGADFWTTAERPLEPLIKRNRYVFVTGDGDFNRREMRKVFARYQDAGAAQSLLLDFKGFGHQLPDAAQFARALEFLDAR